MIECKLSRSDYAAEAGVKRGEHKEYNIFGEPAVFFTKRRSVLSAAAIDHCQQDTIFGQ